MKKENPTRRVARKMLSAHEVKAGVNPFDGATWEARKVRREKKQLSIFKREKTHVKK
jgi:hypothetical protein